MKVTLEELGMIVREVIAEAKKELEVKESDPPAETPGYQHADSLDFSPPLGDCNLYKQQGSANFGPYTESSALMGWLDSIITEELGPAHVIPEMVPVKIRTSGNVWEDALQVHELVEKYIGFQKLKGKLAHKKGVRNPAALAASIGRKKYGSKVMAKKAAAGKKK